MTRLIGGAPSAGSCNKNVKPVDLRPAPEAPSGDKYQQEAFQSAYGTVIQFLLDKGVLAHTKENLDAADRVRRIQKREKNRRQSATPSGRKRQQRRRRERALKRHQGR